MGRAALVTGAGGFIGAHLVGALRREGVWVRGVDVRAPEFEDSAADEFVLADLRDPQACREVVGTDFDEVYQLAADMGGAGYIFTGENDAQIVRNSAAINLSMVGACADARVPRVFFSSSACVYAGPGTSEDSAYPAMPDSEYGWEKLFSERLYLTHGRVHGLAWRVARFHNVFGPLGTWCGGREKAPAALCRKIAEARDGDEIEIWGDGRQLRSFLYIDEAIEGTLRLMRSDYERPVNVGSAEMLSIDDLARTISGIAGKEVVLRHIPGPVGVQERTSDNTLVARELDWAPSRPLREGLEVTYRWIEAQVRATHGQALTLRTS